MDTHGVGQDGEQRDQGRTWVLAHSELPGLWLGTPARLCFPALEEAGTCKVGAAETAGHYWPPS